MTRYWINFKGKQSGPHTIEEIERMGVDKTAYVWHSGLDDWVKITKVTELNEMLEKMPKGTDSTPESSVVENDPPKPAQVNELPDEEVPELPPNYVGARVNGAFGDQRPAGYYPQYATGATVSASPAAVETPKCPPTNLVWAIISTLCCCWPLGVVGIFFAFSTKRHYKEGNYQKAEKHSEYGAWAIILSIVLGLILMPLACSHVMLQYGG